METNSNYIKLQGKAEVEKPLIVGNNYTIINSGTIVSETVKDNDNGTVDRMFTFKVIQSEITGEKGESIKAKDVRSNSTLLRQQAYSVWRDKQINTDFDSFYNELCKEYMSMCDLVSNKIKIKYD